MKHLTAISPVIFLLLSCTLKCQETSVFLATPQYICPMHTHISRDHEGECPICGMDLVKRTHYPIGESRPKYVAVSGAMQQAMALTTEPAIKSTLSRFIKTFGSVQFNEKGLSHKHPRAAGWIENLTVNSVGQEVEKGELLYKIYSPDLLVAQEDFLSLLSSLQNNKALLKRGRRRLSLLGLSDKLINQIETTRQVLDKVPYYAQEAGIVSVLNVREGMYVEASDRIMTLADLSKVWVIADIFAHQLDWVSVGQTVEIDLPALNIHQIKGEVEFVYPTLNPITRSLQVRIVLENPNLRLKPDMLATVRIYASDIEALNIPLNALIQTEKFNSIFVQTDDQHFQRRKVEVGIITQNRAEILKGLDEGEKVVTAGQFLLDAEASLSNVATVNTEDNAMPHQH